MADEIARPFTPEEVAMLRTIFRDRIAYDKVRVHDRHWMFFLPNDRSMAPNGDVYLPGRWYMADVSAPTAALDIKANLVHEATHLYQWYGLGQTVWLRGPFNRNYDYTLEPDKRFEDYGLEQMGMIAEHYYILRQGGHVQGLHHTLRDYAALLPVR